MRFITMFLASVSFVFCIDIFKPLPVQIPDVDYNVTLARLGKKIFFDTRISQNNISCNSCHHLKGELSGTTKNFYPNPITVLNSANNSIYGYRGETKTLQTAIEKMIFYEKGYRLKKQELIANFKKIPEYREKFSIFKNGITYNNIVKSLEHFIKALNTRTPFDAYLEGDENAISDNAKMGIEIFKKSGCISCHKGINIGGSSVAMMKNKQVKKVPSLRNIRLTGPYLVKGHAKTIMQAVILLDVRDVKTNFTDQEYAYILEFFNALNGEIPQILKESDDL